MRKIAVFTAGIALSVLFAAITLLLWINPESRRLIKWKLRTGALLLSLNGMVLACSAAPVVMCYMPPDDDFLMVSDAEYDETSGLNTLTASASGGDQLEGTIHVVFAENWSWRIETAEGVAAQTGDIILLTETSDYGNARFTITLPPLSAGEYTMIFFETGAMAQSHEAGQNGLYPGENTRYRLLITP